MRRTLFLIACIALSVPSVATADSPCSDGSSATDALSLALAASEDFDGFHFRLVTLLVDDRLTAMVNADDPDRDEDDEVGDKLMLIEDSQEQTEPDTVKTGVQEREDSRNDAAEARVNEAIDEASAGQWEEERELSLAPLPDGARLAMRLAELNKPGNLLTVAMPKSAPGDEPVNQAAMVFDQTPQWIAGRYSVPPPPQRVHIAFFHNPTYYQELNLERCGRLDCERCGYLQNLYSSMWFVGNTVLLPYRLASQPPCQCVLSYGDCPSCHRYDCSIEPLRFGQSCFPTSRGVLSQSAALAGFVLLLW